MWPQWKASAELLDQALSEFGFDVDFSQVPAPRLVSDVDTHNFDVLLWPSDGNPHTLYDVTQTGATALGYGVTDPATERSVTGKPVEVTVPAAGGDGERTVNLVDLWHRLGGQSDPETTADAVATFARWWNHALPISTSRRASAGRGEYARFRVGRRRLPDRRAGEPVGVPRAEARTRSSSRQLKRNGIRDAPGIDSEYRSGSDSQFVARDSTKRRAAGVGPTSAVHLLVVAGLDDAAQRESVRDVEAPLPVQGVVVGLGIVEVADVPHSP